uniref:Acyl-coenzyme A thioesterase 4-like n=1 Tax=Gouania willdenowi TaxID=441366 RepID=A0A8C5HC28_GOUWI
MPLQRSVAPILCVQPSRALVDEKFTVLVKNLPPGGPFTVRSLHLSEDNDYWEAYGHYVSNHQGELSVWDDLSFGGTYTGREPMGLLSSMRPIPGSRPGLRLRKKDVTTPMLVTISVYCGHEDYRDQTPLASVLTERWHMAPGVQRFPLQENTVRGTLFIPPGPGPFPGILDMWGGGGGLLEYRAALLASHGYVCLALEYFKPGEMTSANQEFSYFETAFNVIKDHPQVKTDRVGILGLSLGSAVTLNLATESSVVEPRCIVCVKRYACIPPPLSAFGSTPIGCYWFLLVVFDPRFPVKHDENNCEIWREMILPLLKDSSRKVKVEKLRCPMLCISGCDDQNWPAVESVDDVMETLRAVGKDHLLTRADYPDAGHLIEPPFTPHFRATNFIRGSTMEKVVMLWGGQTKPHSEAQEDSWRKILSFLQHNLYGNDHARSRL